MKSDNNNGAFSHLKGKINNERGNLYNKYVYEFFKGNLNSKNFKYLPLRVILSAMICNMYPSENPKVKYLLFEQITE